MAFGTSVVGLVTSLAFSWFEKNRLHSVRRLIARWNDELERRIKRITHEDLAYRQLHELQRQSVFMEEFTTHIAYNIADALGQKLDDRLVPALVTLTRAVEDMRDHRNQMTTDMLAGIVREFQSALTANAGEELRALSQGLQTMNDSLRPLLQEVTEVQKQMKDASEAISTHITESYRTGSEEFSRGMSAVMNNMAMHIGDLGEMLSERLKQTFEQGRGEFERLLGLFSERSGDLEQAGQLFRAVMDGAGEFLRELQHTAREVKDASQRIASALEHLGNATGRMEKIAEETGRIHGSLQTLSMKLAEGLTQFHQTQETLKSQWQSYCHRFENVDGSLARVFENLRTGLESFATMTKNYLIDLDKHAGNITTSFGGAVKELQETIEDLIEGLNSGK